LLTDEWIGKTNLRLEHEGLGACPSRSYVGNIFGFKILGVLKSACMRKLAEDGMPVPVTNQYSYYPKGLTNGGLKKIERTRPPLNPGRRARKASGVH
jgi:hypothetical protein